MKRLITVQHFQDGLSIRMTQEYEEDYGGGHYQYAIMKNEFAILHVGSSSGAAPQYKIAAALAADRLREWAGRVRGEDLELYGLSKGAK